MKLKIIFIFVIIIVIKKNTVCESNREIIEAEKAIIDNIFQNYDKSLRPDSFIEIKFSLHLNDIITLIERDQILIINAFIDHVWIDNRLIWKPEEHKNVTLLRINNEKLWTPDTFIGYYCYYSVSILVLKSFHSV
jgi:hypothetical protein